MIFFQNSVQIPSFIYTSIILLLNNLHFYMQTFISLFGLFLCFLLIFNLNSTNKVNIFLILFFLLIKGTNALIFLNSNLVSKLSLTSRTSPFFCKKNNLLLITKNCSPLKNLLTILKKVQFLQSALSKDSGENKIIKLYKRAINILEIEEAKKTWDFNTELFPSITSDEGTIIVVRNLKAKD